MHDARPLNYHDLVVRHTISALVSGLLVHHTISDFTETLLICAIVKYPFVVSRDPTRDFRFELIERTSKRKARRKASTPLRNGKIDAVKLPVNIIANVYANHFVVS